MRIALVNDYSLAHIGGAVASMFEQKKALQAAGHEVVILQLGSTKPSKTYNASDIIHIKPTFTLPKLIYNLPILFTTAKHDRLIKQILKKHRIEVVHCQSEMTLAHLVARNAQALKLPIFFTVHTFFWEYLGPTPEALAAPAKKLYERAFREKIKDLRPQGNAFEKLLKNVTLNLAAKSTAVFSPSQHQKETLEKTDLKTPVYVVPNPFSSSLAAPNFVKNDGHVPHFVWVGRCVPEKRPLEFLEGVKRARARTSRPFIVDIVGNGTLFKEMVERYAADNVAFHGHVSHDEAVNLIDAGDIVCTSSYHFDNQPMIIAEAVSRYRGVLYCDERLTEGTNIAGYLTKDETADSIAAAIVDLVEHPKKIAELSRKAKQAAAIFAPKTFVKTVTEIYRQ